MSQTRSRNRGGLTPKGKESPVKAEIKDEKQQPDEEERKEAKETTSEETLPQNADKMPKKSTDDKKLESTDVPSTVIDVSMDVDATAEVQAKDNCTITAADDVNINKSEVEVLSADVLDETKNEDIWVVRAHSVKIPDVQQRSFSELLKWTFGSTFKLTKPVSQKNPNIRKKHLDILTNPKTNLKQIQSIIECAYGVVEFKVKRDLVPKLMKDVFMFQFQSSFLRFEIIKLTNANDVEKKETVKISSSDGIEDKSESTVPETNSPPATQKVAFRINDLGKVRSFCSKVGHPIPSASKESKKEEASNKRLIIKNIPENVDVDTLNLIFPCASVVECSKEDNSTRTAILETVLPVHVQKYLDMYESVELNEQQVELSTPFATAEEILRNRARLRYTVEQKFGKGVVSKILTNRLSPTGRNIGSLSAKAGQKRKQPGSRWQPSKRGKFIPPSKRGKFAPSSRAQESRKGYERRGNQRGGMFRSPVRSSRIKPLFDIDFSSQARRDFDFIGHRQDFAGRQPSRFEIERQEDLFLEQAQAQVAAAQNRLLQQQIQMNRMGVMQDLALMQRQNAAAGVVQEYLHNVSQRMPIETQSRAFYDDPFEASRQVPLSSTLDSTFAFERFPSLMRDSFQGSSRRHNINRMAQDRWNMGDNRKSRRNRNRSRGRPYK